MYIQDSLTIKTCEVCLCVIRAYSQNHIDLFICRLIGRCPFLQQWHANGLQVNIPYRSLFA